MSMHDHSQHEGQSHDNFLTSRAGLVLLGFLVIGGALLFTEHRAHVLGALIWLPLLACPLMHLFMHHGHGDHGGHAGHAEQDPKRSAP
ncbi:MAG: DUF2933 domain-containing protein [Rhizobiales bacterium]|nr:DUF2933 domain-containing protein [Hyphomicrobiales bacterium]